MVFAVKGQQGPLGLYQRQTLFLSFSHCLDLSRATSTLCFFISCFTHMLLLILLQDGSVFCNSFWAALQRPELLLQHFALTVMPYVVPAVHPGRLCPRLSRIS